MAFSLCEHSLAVWTISLTPVSFIIWQIVRQANSLLVGKNLKSVLFSFLTGWSKPWRVGSNEPGSLLYIHLWPLPLLRAKPCDWSHSPALSFPLDQWLHSSPQPTTHTKPLWAPRAPPSTALSSPFDSSGLFHASDWVVGGGAAVTSEPGRQHATHPPPPAAVTTEGLKVKQRRSGEQYVGSLLNTKKTLHT